jgi:ribosomal protein L37AE/L43A
MGQGQAEECEACGTTSVTLTRYESSGAEVWTCEECGDVKRRCPASEEGWVRLLRAVSDDLEVYVCEECEASWEEASEIRPDRAIPLHEYLKTERKTGSYLKLKVVRENVNGDVDDAEDDAA